MAQNGRERARRRQKQRRRRTLRRIITALVVVIALLLAVNFLFRVETIRVEGAQHYTSSEVVRASGIQEGTCMYLVNKFAAARQIADTLPYVEDVDIYRELPSTMVIHVTERVRSAVIRYGASSWALDENGTVLDQAVTEEDLAITEVMGLEVLQAEKGSRLVVPSEQEENLRKLTAVLSALAEQGDVGIFDTIDVSRPDDVTCSYDGGRITVRFGACEDMVYRLRFFRAILAEQSPDAVGTIDLTDSSSARFIGA